MTNRNAIVVVAIIALASYAILWYQAATIEQLHENVASLRSSVDAMHHKLLRLTAKVDRAEWAPVESTNSSDDSEAPLDIASALRELSSKNLVKRYNAGRALKQAGPAAVPGLLDVIASGNSPARKAALFIIGDMRDRSALPRIRELAVQSHDEYVRAGCIGLLAKMRDEDATSILVDALRDPAREVRSAAVAGIRRLDVYAALPSLLEMLAKEKDVLAREIEKTLLSLARSDVAEFGKALQSLPPELRFQVLTIVDSDKSTRVDELLKTSLADTDPRVALASARLLAKRGDASGKSIAERILRDSENDAGELKAIATEVLHALESVGN